MESKNKNLLRTILVAVAAAVAGAGVTDSMHSENPSTPVACQDCASKDLALQECADQNEKLEAAIDRLYAEDVYVDEAGAVRSREDDQE